MFMKKSVCYVDDDEEEIKRFRDNLASRYILGTGTTLTAALDDLRAQGISKPDLILLDLYFGPHPDPIKRREMLEADAELAQMESRVRKLLSSSGQTPEEGFNLADEAAKRCPRVPRAFFSRRAYLDDAMKAHERGLTVLEKPDPDENEDYDSAFKRHADVVISKIDRIIYLNGFLVRHRQRIEGFFVGILAAVAKFGWDLLTK
jgi:CheY-like chemotaxis protein